MKKLILTALATITLSFSAFADKYYFDSTLTVEDIYIAETNLATYLESAGGGSTPEELKKVMAAINYETESPGLVYEEREDSEDLWVTGYEREDDSELLLIPAYHNGKKVNIAGNADFDNEEITTLIYWGNTIENGNGQVINYNLENLVLPNIKIIPDWWFGDKNITSLYAPNVERIGQCAFSGTKLIKIDLPSLKYAGTDAFAGTPVTEVIVPELLEMNATMFGPNVTYLHAPKVQRVRGSSNSSRYNKTCFSSITNLYLPSCEEFGNHCFYGSEEFPKYIYAPKLKRMGKDNWLPGLVEIDFPMCTDWEAKMVIPEYKGRPEHHKQYYYPDNTSLTRVVLGVEQLRDHAFRRCRELQAVELPNLVQGGRWAFEGCTNLFYADLPKMTKSAWGMFQNCSKLGYVNMQRSLDIEGKMFFGCERIHQVVDESKLKAVYGEYTIEDVCKPFTRIVEDEETGEERKESYYKDWQERMFNNYNYLAVVASKVKTVGKKAFSINRDKKEEKTDETSGWIFLQGKDIRDVATTDGKTIYVIDYDNGIWKSTDGGISWNLVFSDNEYSKIIISNDGSKIFALDTISAYIARSLDVGVSWDVIDISTGQCFESIETFDGNTLFTSLELELYKSTDGGDSWNKIQNTPFTSNISDIAMKDNNTIYITCPLDTETYCSIDGGNTWDLIYDWGSFKNIAYSDECLYFAATANNIWVKYDNNNPIQILNEFDDDIISLDCSSDGKTIYVITDMNEIFIINRTGDSLDNYEYEINHSAFSRQTDFTDVTSISTCDGKTIYVANPGSDGAHKSEDGGKTWNWIISGETINRVYSPNENTVYLQLSTEIWKSIDGGQSYDTIYTFDKEYDIEAFGGNGNTLCFYSSGGDDLFISIDGGESWIDRTGTAGGSNPCISITKDGIIFILSDNHIIYKSSDYGENWEYFEIDTESNPSIIRVEAIDENIMYGLTDDPFFVKSIDGGHTWLPEPLNTDIDIGSNICKDKFGNIYGVKSNGDIYKRIPESDSTRSAEEDEPQNGNLEVIDLPTVETIKTAAFKNQTHLHSIQISRCEVIGSTAFKNCGSADFGVYISPEGKTITQDVLLGQTTFEDLGVVDITISHDNQTWYILNQNGQVWKSIDEGKHWFVVCEKIDKSVSSSEYIRISTYDGNIVYACNGNTSGGLYKSEDGGKTWERISNEVINQMYIQSVAVYETTVFAGDDDIRAFKSIDNGEIWEQVSDIGSWVYNIFIQDQDNIYIASVGSCYYSSDGGYNWEPLNIPDVGSDFTSIIELNGKLYLSARNYYGIIVKEKDSDEYHTVLAPDGESIWFDGMTLSPDKRSIYLSGYWDGERYIYRFDIETEIIKKADFNHYFRMTSITSIDTIEGNTIYMCGDVGSKNKDYRLIKSIDGGHTWEGIKIDEIYKPEQVTIANDNGTEVLYVSDNAYVYVLSDDEWIQIKDFSQVGDIRCIKAARDNSVLYVSVDSQLFREEKVDGQWRWSENIAPSDTGDNSINITVLDDCILIGNYDNDGVWRSFDKGDTWEKISDQHPIYEFVATDSNTIYFIDDAGAIQFYKSSDGGNNIDFDINIFNNSAKLCIDTNDMIYLVNVANGDLYAFDASRRPAKETEISYGTQKPEARFIESVDFTNVRKIGENTFVNCGFGYLNFIKNNDNREYYLEAWHDVDLSFPSMSEIPPMSSFTNSVKIGNVTFGTGLIVKDKNNEFTAITIGDRAEDSIVGPYSIAHGTNTVASGNYSIASGENVKATGLHSIAIGKNAEASGENSVSIGKNTQATGEASHAEGGGNTEVEGYPTGTAATGEYAHSEGTHTLASGVYAHAEGSMTIAGGKQSHSEGWRTQATGTESHAEGYNTSAFGNRSHAEGANTIASNSYAHAEGNNTKAINESSHAEGSSTTASGKNSHSEGEKTQATNLDSHAEGRNTKAFGQFSHAEGDNTAALGNDAHSEGNGTYAVGSHSHSEGYQTFAIANQTHTEGNGTVAASTRAHAEGYQMAALGSSSHAEGTGGTVSGAANKKTTLSRISTDEGYAYNSSVNFSSHWEQAIYGVIVVNTNSVYIITDVSGTTIYLNKEIDAEDASNIIAYCTMWKYGAKGYSSHAAGYHAMANNDYSWVWNGDTNVNNYSDTRTGTFNINPVDGASGFYIGNQSLQDYLDGVQPDLSNYSITINGDEQTLDSNPNFTIDIPPDLSANTITINGEAHTLGENPTYILDKIEKEISNNGLTIKLSIDKNELYFSSSTANTTNYIVLPQSDYDKLGKIIIYVEENPEENAYYDFSGALSDSFAELETKPWLTSTNNSTWKIELISPPGNIKWSCDTFKEYVKDDISKMINTLGNKYEKYN